LAIVLQPVEVAEHCYLAEALYWLAFNRLPLARYRYDGSELRFSREMDLNVSELGQIELSESECIASGLGLHPYIVKEKNGKTFSTVEFYDKIIEVGNWSPDENAQFKAERAEAVIYEAEVKLWNENFDSFLEYYKAKLFVELREDKIKASGIPVNGSDNGKLLASIAANNFELDINKSEIIDFNNWTMSRIDWENCILYCNEHAYCWVSFNVDDLLSTYGPPENLPASEVIKVGDLYVLNPADDIETASQTRRGRPALPWDQFHLEVAALVAAKALPDKKEAAIRHFEEWFVRHLGVQVGRSSIGTRLSPYYDRFVWNQVKTGPA
jgi:hypothetical protein